MEGPGDYARVLFAAVHFEIPAQKVFPAVVLEAFLRQRSSKRDTRTLNNTKKIRKSNLKLSSQVFRPSQRNNNKKNTTNKARLKRGLRDI